MKDTDRLKVLAEVVVANWISANLDLGSVVVNWDGQNYKLTIERIEKETRQQCKVLATNLSEISTGTVGTILKEENDGAGYAVEFTGIFKRAGQSLADANKPQTKVFYLGKNEVEILPNDTESVRAGSDKS